MASGRAAITRRGLLAALALLGTAHKSGGTGNLRVAAMNWGPASALLALGIVPVAVPDIAGYRAMVSEPAMPEGVVDLGSTWEPNIELLQRVAPDLVLTVSWQESFRPLYQRVARTVSFAVEPGGQDLAAERRAIAELGERLGRQDAARAYLARVDRVLATGSAAVLRRDRPLYLVSLHGDARHVSVFGRGHVVQDVLDRLGIENAWSDTRNAWGIDMVGVERLAERPEATILYVEDGTRSRRTLSLLERSALWSALPAVKAGLVHPIPEFYPYGGLPTAMQVADYLVAALGNGKDDDA